MTELNQPSLPEPIAIIDERKLDYLFNKEITSDEHNSARGDQNLQQLLRLGFNDTPEDRTLLKNHLQQVVKQSSNVLNRYINKYRVDTEERESLLAGRSGKFAKIRSSWEVMPDETRRFLTAIFFGS